VSREAPIAISPDGRHLVYGVGLGVKSHLVHQSLDSFDPQSLEGTDDAAIPTFLPKGDAVGFFSKSTGRIERVSLAGGSVTKVVDAPDLIGCSWGADGTLVFDSNWGTPLRISRPGASAIVELTKIAAGTGQAHVWPQVLPGDRAALFTVWTGAPTWDEAEIAVVDLATGQQKIVLRGGAYGRYSSSGHLVFWRANALMAVRFDLQSLEVKGEPVKVLSDVRIDAKSGSAHFAISDNGTLAYINGRVDTFAESFIVDRSAKAVVRLDESESTGLPTFSPDGTRVALTLYRGGTFGIGVFDLQRKLLTPFALSGDNALEGWTRKGDRVVFQSNAAGEYNFYAIPVAGAGQPTQLFSKTKGLTPFGSTWSSDERSLVYVASGAKTGSDLWIVDFDKEKTPRPLLETAANEVFPSISPNGRFIAYTSDESGRPEIYVRPFPQVETGRQKISGSGGTMPRWGRDGTTIFYRTDQGIMAVNVAAGRGGADLLTVGQPSLAVAITGLTAFDPSPDARTFAIERVPTEKAAKEIHVVLNWFDELRRLVP
jgi:serine/threonine-protein kinase